MLDAPQRGTSSGAQAFGVALTDAFVLVFAAFTLACQVTVLSEGTPAQLWLLGSIALAVPLMALAALGFARPGLITEHIEDGLRVGVPVQLPVPGIGFLAACVLALAAALLTRSAWLASACGLAACAYVLARALGRSPVAPATDTPPEPLAARLVVDASALLAGAVALLVVRPRSDDAFYTSMARSLTAAPDLPLLSASLVHGPPTRLLGPQPMFPPYRVHSFELLGGYLAGLFDLDPTAVLHLGLGTLIAVLTPYALARLLRQLFPSGWVYALCGVMLFYLVEGTASVGYANQAFVRAFHGKSALLTLGVPLVLSHGLRLGEAPSLRRFVWLALASIAAVGMSSTALWLAPVLAVVGAVAAAPSLRKAPQRALIAAAATAYVLALGLWVMGQLRTTRSVRADDLVEAKATAPRESLADAQPRESPALTEPLAYAVQTALGPDRTATVLLAVVPCMLAAVPLALPWRVFGLLGLVLTVFTLPPLALPIGKLVTGVTTYHRVFWLLPIPLASGLAAAGLFARLRPRGRMLATSGTLAAVAIGYLLGVDRLVLSEANNVKLVFPPALKVGQRPREAALAACELAPAGHYILASPSVSEQVALLRGCGYPVIAAERWMLAPRAERERRAQLARYLTVGEDVTVEGAGSVLEALEHYSPRVVVVTSDAMRNRRMRLLLRMAGYEKATNAGDNQLLIRGGEAKEKEARRAARELCEQAGRGSRLLAPFALSLALEEHGACSTLFSVRRALRRYDASFDEPAQLDRLISTDTVLQPDDWARLRAFLSPDVSGVVLATPAFGNPGLKAWLRAIGYDQVSNVRGYRLLLRAPERPRPEP